MSEARPNVAEFTVSEIAFAVKRTIEDAYGFVRVRGEISGYRGPHSSGHAYFSLKDDKARVEAVVWRGSFQKLRFKPEEGMEVIATGKLTTFPGGSKYQIVIESLEPAGVGALMALLEERRRKLAAEGLFDEERKRPLPFLPRVVGVVTSPTGAVIRDILHRLTDRFPVQVVVWPVRVQGETSAAEVAAAIEGFNALAPGGRIPRPDLLIVARGGGSLEDLWSFNEEVVVRAAAGSTIPLISAVGHETDWTLIDHVSDRRAPTPTGAAEMAVPVRSELVATVEDLARRLAGCALRGIENRRSELRAAARALRRPADLVAPARQRLDLAGARLDHALAAASRVHRSRFEKAAGRLSPAGLMRLIGHSRDRAAGAGTRADRLAVALVGRRRERLDGLALRLRPDRAAARLAEARLGLERVGGRLDRAHVATIDRHRKQLDAATKLLGSLGYRGVLARGYALARDADGHVIRSADGVPAADAFQLTFADGEVGVRRAEAAYDASLAETGDGRARAGGDAGAAAAPKSRKPKTVRSGAQEGGPARATPSPAVAPLGKPSLDTFTATPTTAPSDPEPLGKPTRRAKPPGDDQGSLF